MHGVPTCSWFDDFCLPEGGLRHPTFKAALTLLADITGDTGHALIAETGCQRMVNDWGAGMSSTIFAKFLQKYYPETGMLLSCDINPNAVALANAVTEEYAQNRRVIVKDSVDFLTNFDSIGWQLVPQFMVCDKAYKIDLLYLDSWDFPDGELRAVVGDDWPNTEFHNAREILGDKLAACQSHCLNELKAAEKHMANTCIVLIDDNSLPGGGKSWEAKQYMLNNRDKYTPILDSYQSLWLYKG